MEGVGWDVKGLEEGRETADGCYGVGEYQGSGIWMVEE